MPPSGQGVSQLGMHLLGKQAKILAPLDLADLLAFADCSRHPLRNRVIVLLSAKAGLRAGEIAGLTWDMVLDANGQLPFLATASRSSMALPALCRGPKDSKGRVLYSDWPWDPEGRFGKQDFRYVADEDVYVCQNFQHCICLSVSTAEPRWRLIRLITISRGEIGCRGPLSKQTIRWVRLPPWRSLGFLPTQGSPPQKEPRAASSPGPQVRL